MPFLRNLSTAINHLIRYPGSRKLFRNELINHPRLSGLLADFFHLKPKYQLRFYHYFFLTVLMGEWVALLHGRWLSVREELRLLWLSAAIAISDDWFDDKEMPVDDILTRLTDPSQMPVTTISEKLVQELMNLVSENVDDFNNLYPFLRDFWEGERQSVAQFSGQLTPDELFRVSVLKSFNTVLLCRQVIDLPVLDGERVALWEIAATGQVMDDVMDLYDDFHEGIQTPATIRPDMKSLCMLSNKQVVSMVSAIRQVTTPRKNQDQVISSVAFMPSVLKLALNQFQEHQNSDSTLPLETITRKKMICDLDRPSVLAKLTMIFLLINPEHPQHPVCS